MDVLEARGSHGGAPAADLGTDMVWSEAITNTRRLLEESKRQIEYLRQQSQLSKPGRTPAVGHSSSHSLLVASGGGSVVVSEGTGAKAQGPRIARNAGGTALPHRQSHSPSKPVSRSSTPSSRGLGSGLRSGSGTRKVGSAHGGSIGGPTFGASQSSSSTAGVKSSSYSAQQRAGSGSRGPMRSGAGDRPKAALSARGQAAAPGRAARSCGATTPDPFTVGVPEDPSEETSPPRQPWRSGSAVLVGVGPGVLYAGSDRGGAGSINSNVSSSSGGNNIFLGNALAFHSACSSITAAPVVTPLTATVTSGTRRVLHASAQTSVLGGLQAHVHTSHPVVAYQEPVHTFVHHPQTTTTVSSPRGWLAAMHAAAAAPQVQGSSGRERGTEWEQEEISELLTALSHGASAGEGNKTPRGRNNAEGSLGLAPELIEKFQRVLQDRLHNQVQLEAAEAKISQLERRNTDLAVENCRLRSTAIGSSMTLQPASLVVTPRKLNDSGNLAVVSEPVAKGWSMRLSLPQSPATSSLGGQPVTAATMATRSVSCSNSAAAAGSSISRFTSEVFPGSASVQVVSPHACGFSGMPMVVTAIPASPPRSATISVARARSESPGARSGWGSAVLAGLGPVAAAHLSIQQGPSTQPAGNVGTPTFTSSPVVACRVMPMRQMTPTPDREATYASSAGSNPPGSFGLGQSSWTTSTFSSPVLVGAYSASPPQGATSAVRRVLG
mmetsp:Transcript_54525/g.156760  ORF Transcript_54525/g.156760 Transcript_54525/m.156760 type:complete len:723 (-) Transcript_54525:85-2253(-)